MVSGRLCGGWEKKWGEKRHREIGAWGKLAAELGTGRVTEMMFSSAPSWAVGGPFLCSEAAGTDARGATQPCFPGAAKLSLGILRRVGDETSIAPPGPSVTGRTRSASSTTSVACRECRRSNCLGALRTGACRRFVEAV